MSDLPIDSTKYNNPSDWTITTIKGKTPYRCPVCEGRGIVPHGFYLYPAGQTFTDSETSPEKCRSCNGTGIVEV
jgi:DnaJ-class molecular chaperone